MIRTLLLLRHAKSSWDEPNLADFDRPLAPRGTKDAPRIAAYLRKKKLRPELTLCSPALRAVQTWHLITESLGRENEVKSLDDLYLSPPSRLLRALKRVPPDIRCVMLVGHNPGLENLAELLSGPKSKKKALSYLRDKFPTAALAVVEFETDAWSNINHGQGRLRRFVRPRDL
jgi:phosphohistidine phosphatase